MKKSNTYDKKYGDQNYYWGKKPSAMCDTIIQIMRPNEKFHPRLLDLGCGEGRNAVYFAKHGFEVVGLDISAVGLEKTKKYAEEERVHVRTIRADINDYQLTEIYDVIFSTGTLHFLSPKIRKQKFQNYKNHTSPNGIHAMSVFVKKPFIPIAPDADKNAFSFKSGELMSYYWDWKILFCIEDIFDCMSSGIPHKHAVNRIIAGKYTNNEH